MMANNDKKITARLKEIIDRHGPNYLSDEPYPVYEELIGSGVADKKTAGAILYFLVNGLLKEAYTDSTAESLTEKIQRGCSFNKRMADRLASIFLSLYSDENQADWTNRDMEGLAQFMKEELSCRWNGFAVWEAGNGTVDCHYKAEILLLPQKTVGADEELQRLLKKNPFMKKEAIQELFEERLRDYLDDEFEEYCTCDDYYQPVVEDFEMDDRVKDWCTKNGFQMVSCEGDGYDDGYEPSFRQG